MASRNGKCSNCGRDYAQLRRGLCKKCGEAEKVAAIDVTPTEATVADDLKKQKFVRELTALKGKYTNALKTIEEQQVALSTLGYMQERLEPVEIAPHYGAGTSEATPVIVASDWHSEEIVTLADTSGLNESNPELSEAKIKKFFQSSFRLVKLLNQDVKINTVVLALLGDFITGQIHGAANAEKNGMGPADAIVFVQNLIVGGIQFYLDNSNYNFVIVCKVGNHGRITDKTRFGAETSHSLEYLLYRYLEACFKGEGRVRFVIDTGYHTYLPIYGQTVRFHHGHAVNFGGGVGGLTIPANKKIANWNQARKVDLDIFGHFHQSHDTRRFVCNGSLIGYNSYALSIGAEWEPPSQTLLLFDKKRGKTCKWPILLES